LFHTSNVSRRLIVTRTHFAQLLPTLPTLRIAYTLSFFAQAALVARFTAEIVPKLGVEGFGPIVHSSFSLGDIGQAHAAMEANTNIGKIVVMNGRDTNDDGEAKM